MHKAGFLSLALLLSLYQGSEAFKAADFKKCTDSNFCTRHRGVQGPHFRVEPSSIDLKPGGREVNAKLLEAQSNSAFDLSLTAYEGIVRLRVKEPAKRRFEVPDVLQPEFITKPAGWTSSKTSSKSLLLHIGPAAATLQYEPFHLSIAVDGKEAFDLNSRSMFGFEHLREKQEGDPAGMWEETFRSHTDSKPKGPEAISLDLGFPDAHHVFGLPQHASAFSLVPTAGDNISAEPYRLFNLDVFEYDHDSRFGLYGAIPFLVAHTSHATVGAFWLNAAEMYIDVEKSGNGVQTQWIAESGILDLFLLLGPTPAQVSKQYSQLTGTTTMPQLFALGYHQCRWNYRDEADVAEVNQGFDDHDIPYDVIWLDIEYTDGKRYFTWDKGHFPHPKEMQQNLADHGRKLVAIIDPHIKQDSNYYVQVEGQKRGCFVKDKSGDKDFDGWCWPGSSYYFDAMSPDARAWWAEQFQLDKWAGSTTDLYLWNDMNEPSVFNGPEVTTPKDVIHFGGWENRDVHNIYGMMVHRATAEGMLERGRRAFGPEGDRPFVLSRAFFAGTQRYGAIWTGDNAASWDHLRVSVPMLLSISLAGLSFCGADVGGFFGNPDAEMAVRWWQLGAFTPFFRGHGHLDTKRREPWLFGEPHTTHVRQAIRRRYALLPYLYTLFRQANLHGIPIMRPFWYEFPTEEALFDSQDSFMLGPGLLVAPVLEAGATERQVYLPLGSQWYDGQSGKPVPGQGGMSSFPVTMEGIPTFLRGGSVLPLQERPRRSSKAMLGDPYTLIVALDALAKASGELYLDDGRSYAFEGGKFAHRVFTFADNILTSTALPGTSSAGYQPGNQVERIIVLGLPGELGAWAVTTEDGGRLQAEAGPLTLAPGLPSTGLVIRKPGMNVAGDWSLRFEAPSRVS